MFLAALRGQKGVAVAVLRGPSRPFVDKKVLPLPFSAALRGPSWTKRCCRCRSSRPFVALRGQKGVAVAVLRGPSWPFVDKKVLPLPFFAALRGPSWTKRCCRCRSPRPFVRGQKGVAVAVLRGPSRPFVDKRVLPLPFLAVLRGPSWIKKVFSAARRGSHCCAAGTVAGTKSDHALVSPSAFTARTA